MTKSQKSEVPSRLVEWYFNLSTTSEKFTSKNQYGKAFQGNILLIATFVGEIILSEVLRTRSSTNFAKKASVEIVVNIYNIINMTFSYA